MTAGVMDATTDRVLTPPRTFEANIEYRDAIRRWAIKSKANRDYLMDRCKHDFVFFIETFCWLVEPRPDDGGAPPVIPFIPWEHQRPVIEIILKHLGFNDIGLEKARGEGASWICLMIILWRWLFWDMQTFGLVSRNELAADNPDDPDSLGWKCLKVDTPVLSEGGWVRIGDIKEGDRVFGSSGTLTTVVRAMPEKEDDLYDVYFSDGTSITCTSDHLWTVSKCSDRMSGSRRHKYGNYQTIPLSEIAQSLKHNKRYNWQLKEAQPIQYPHREFVIDPYNLGVLLGDGCLCQSTVNFTSIDNEVVQEFQKRMCDVLTLRNYGKIGWAAVKTVDKYNGHDGNPYSTELRRLGLRGCRSYDKFIPVEYKTSSVDQRLDLIRGLMDTDGTATSNGRAKYYTASRQLAEDLQFIIGSLGGVARISIHQTSYTYKGEKKSGRASYCVSVSMVENPFLLARKNGKYKPRSRCVNKRIVAVRPAGRGVVKCITVDANDGLFVVDGFTLTHNCDWQISMLPLWMVGKKGVDYVRNISKHTWINKRTGSSITAYPATGDLASGGRKTAFFMDELAKFPRGPDEDAMAATEPVTNCRLLVSTPAGAEGAYYRCMTEPSSMVKLILDWTKNPTRNQNLFTIDHQNRRLINALNGDEIRSSLVKKFFEEHAPILVKRGFDISSKTKIWSPWYVARCLRPRMTPKKVAQEYDRDYGGSASRFFPGSLIEMLVERARTPIIQGDILIDQEQHKVIGFTKMKEGRTKLWCTLSQKKTPPPSDYVVGCDICTGQGGSMSSCSTIIVADRKTGKKVMEYADPNIKPEQLASLAVAVCGWFKNVTGGDAYMIWECNGPGGSFRDFVVGETRFRNFYYRRPHKAPNAKTTKEPGWWSGKEQKRDLLSRYRHALTEGHYENLSEYALRECLCYIEDTGGKIKFISGNNDDIDPANDGENHGDRVIADALANFAMNELNGTLDPAAPQKKQNTQTTPEGSFGYRRKLWLDKQRKASQKDW